MSSQTIKSKSAPPSGPATGAAQGSPPVSPEVAALLDKIAMHLQKDQPTTALELIRKSKLRSPWIDNATAVCQMRQGNAEIAVQVLRKLVLSQGILLRQDVPPVFKINFATALCMADNVSGCLNALAEIDAEDHPAVERLRRAIAKWKRGLTLWQRIRWRAGSAVGGPVRLDFPPGELR